MSSIAVTMAPLRSMQRLIHNFMKIVTTDGSKQRKFSSYFGKFSGELAVDQVNFIITNLQLLNLQFLLPSHWISDQIFNCLLIYLNSSIADYDIE